MSTLSWLGTAGAVAFIVTFTVEGAIRAGYRPVYHPVSALSLGPRGPLQKANFVVSGCLITLGAMGTAAIPTSAVSGALGAITIGLAGLGLIASGVWTMDPMRGYPPGAVTPRRHSRAHHRHDHAGAVVFTAMPLAPLIWAWHFWQQSHVTMTVYSAATGVTAAITSVWFGIAWERDDPRTGLIQRGMLIVSCAWIAVLCAHLAGR